MQGFYFLVKFGLVLIYILKVYRKKSSSILLRKNMFNSLLAFCFWKACTFSSFERFVCWKSRKYWDGRGNNYFSCFPLPPANEHSFNSSRFLPLIFTRSICNYQTDSWWDLFSLDICILFAFSWMQLSWSYWIWLFKVPL